MTSHVQPGRRVRNTFHDGSSWEYGYNDRSEVTSATRKTADGTVVPPLAASYAYDGIGNRTASTSPVLGDRTYTPNALNQYAEIETGNTRTAVGRAPAGWGILVAGSAAQKIGELYYRPLTGANATAPVWQTFNVSRDTGSPSVPNKHFWYPKAEFVPIHDEDGNLLDDGRWLYTWDAENRLIQMETTTAATTAGHPYTKLVFAYDWQGRRTGRHVYQGGTKASPTFKSSTRWLYDGWNPVTEFAASSVGGTLVRARVYTWGLDLSGSLQGAGGVGGLLSALTVTGALKHAPSYDGNGNIVAWTQSNLLAPASRREYDAFGNTVVSEGTAPHAFGFSTKPQDAETGLYYYGYRYLDTVTGRWSSRDPIEEEGGVNLYGFIGNNGVNETDFLGLEGESGYEFFVVGDDVLAEGGPGENAAQARERKLAAASGINHVTMYYGALTNAAELFEGYSARTADKLGFPEFKNDISKRAPITTLQRVSSDESTLRWGDYAGEKCSCASDAMRINCLLASPHPPGGNDDHKPGRNDCQTDVHHAADGCCLTGYVSDGGKLLGTNLTQIEANYIEDKDEREKQRNKIARMATDPFQRMNMGK